MTTPPFDPSLLRARFPAITQTSEALPAIFFDNPGGTQVPQSVIDAVANYYRTSNANVGGAFAASQRTQAVVAEAREAMAALLNAPRSDTIVFGPNMTTLTFHLARSLAGTIKPGDEIVVTNLDHDANVTPWTDLQAAGAIVKVVDINLDDCTLNSRTLQAALSARTRLVAITHASNAVGTVPDVGALTRMAHAAGALVFVDAVQYVPHGPVDVQALDCDFLACSVYKFFGPHIGVLYGKAHHLERLTPHNVRPVKNVIPTCWETGTQNFEGLAGVTAAIDYLTEIGERFGTVEQEAARPGGSPSCGQRRFDRRPLLVAGMRAIRAYEQSLSLTLLQRLQELDGLRLYGITDPARWEERVPTFALTWAPRPARALAEHLARHGICCRSGNFYALRLMERLGLEKEGGALRIGLAHYNTTQEMDALLTALKTAYV